MTAARRARAEEAILPRLLNAPEAARYVGVSETKLRDLVARRQVTEVRIDGCVRYDRRRLDRFIDSLSPDADDGDIDRIFG